MCRFADRSELIETKRERVVRRREEGVMESGRDGAAWTEGKTEPEDESRTETKNEEEKQSE